MSLIRYQSTELSTWPALDRWADLRDELNSLFDLPTTGNFARQAQLFSGWTPALDLYQNNDNVVAVVELPGMRKEDIDVSLHDGMLTIEDYETSWARDPYAPTYRGVDRSVLRFLSDDEKYDGQFPDHPLSKVRRVLTALPGAVRTESRGAAS